MKINIWPFNIKEKAAEDKKKREAYYTRKNKEYLMAKQDVDAIVVEIKAVIFPKFDLLRERCAEIFSEESLTALKSAKSYKQTIEYEVHPCWCARSTFDGLFSIFEKYLIKDEDRESIEQIESLKEAVKKARLTSCD